MALKRYNLSNYQLLTGDMGYIYPIGLQEVLPGDIFRQATSAMVRLSPMAAPVMHPMQIRVHHYFVPHRLVWDKFEDFITGGDDGFNTDTVPTYTVAANDGVSAYWGLPVGMEVGELPLRGYNMIYNEYYRDQDLSTERSEDDDFLARCAWEKDYFTTCRPWEQKGPDVTLPLGDRANIAGEFHYRDYGGAAQVVAQKDSGSLGAAAGGDPYEIGRITIDPNQTESMYADLSAATAVSISSLKRAFALQRFQEARARYGSRYSEYLRYYGVKPSDARLDRPEYLGGGRVRVNVSEVLQTAPETPADFHGSEYGVGDMYGHGIGGLRSRPYRRRFPEHGYVHSFISVRPKAIYEDQVARTFLKRTKFDFFAKEMQHIGQQAVLKGELGNVSAQAETFGYQDRYREYCEAPSQVHGEFKNVLNYWHLARQFQSPAALNEDFVLCDPSKRIFNVQDNHVLWMMIQHHITALRPVARSHMGKII